MKRREFIVTALTLAAAGKRCTTRGIDGRTILNEAETKVWSKPMVKPDRRFLDLFNELARRFEAEQQPNLQKAAIWMADAVEQDRLIYVFGAGGHATLVMQELFWRVGGLANICPMMDVAISMMTPAKLSFGYQTMHEVGTHIVDYYGIGKEDLVLIFHSYGFTAATVDAALEAKRREAKVIGIASSDWQQKTPKDFPLRHRSGKTLFDVADICLDDYVPYGDAVIQLDGLATPVSAISSTIEFYVAHRLEMECVKECLRRGISAPVWWSANLPGGEERNASLRAKYSPRIKSL